MRIGERNWHNPTVPSEEVFRDLCRDHKIQKKEIPVFRIYLEQLVFVLRIMLDDIRGPRQLSGLWRVLDRQSSLIARVNGDLQKLLHLIPASVDGGTWSLFAPPGLDDLSFALAVDLSPLFTAEVLAPIANALPPGQQRNPAGPRPDRAWAHQVIEQHPVEILDLTLGRVQKALADAATLIKAHTPKGGAPRSVVGPWLLSNLAGAYADWGPGRKPSAHREGPFAGFAQECVEALGLPSNWIDRQLAPGVAAWKRRKATHNLDKKS